MNTPAKVVIVDDEMISRGYMELFVKPSKNYEVAASLPFAKDALKYCESHELPDMIIMDVMMSDGVDGLTAAEEIKRRFPEIRVIVATSMAEADWIRHAKDAGIEGFWFKSYSELSLLEVMDRIMAGERVYPDQAPDIYLGKLPASELTGQQRNILRLLTEGLSNKEIAEKLFITSSTVKSHLDEIMEKTEIHSRTALAAKASRLGIVVSDADRTQIVSGRKE